MKISKANRALIDAQVITVRSQRERVDAAIEQYNEDLADLRGMLESESGDAQGDFDDKSERWQEGERGQAASAWIEQIETVASALDPVELDFPDLDEVDQLPDSPDE